MFTFMNSEMPSVFSSAMRGPGRSSYRGADMWDLFEHERRPSSFSFYDPFQTAYHGKRTAYDDTHLAAERPSISFRKPKGLYQNPFNLECNAESYNKQGTPNATRQPLQHHVELSKQLNQDQVASLRAPHVTNLTSRKTEKIYYMNSIISIIKGYLNILITVIVSMMMSVVDTVNCMTNKTLSTFSFKSKSDLVNLENSTSHVKSQQQEIKNTNYKQHLKVKTPEEPSKNVLKGTAKNNNNTTTETNQQEKSQTPAEVKSSGQQKQQPHSTRYVHSTKQTFSQQSRKDLVLIEDVTPARPKWNPAWEPKNGLIIE